MSSPFPESARNNRTRNNKSRRRNNTKNNRNNKPSYSINNAALRKIVDENARKRRIQRYMEEKEAEQRRLRNAIEHEKAVKRKAIEDLVIMDKEIGDEWPHEHLSALWYVLQVYFPKLYEEFNAKRSECSLVHAGGNYGESARRSYRMCTNELYNKYVRLLKSMI